MSSLPFSVNLWASHPDAGNDDCHTGADFAALSAARACFHEPTRAELSTAFVASCAAFAVYVELVGPGVREVRQLRAPVRARNDRHDDARRERAMEAGMAGGCDAYNDAMGWGAA